MIEVAPHPEFAANGSFEHLRLGRNKPAAKPKLCLAKYLDKPTILPAIPATCDYTTGVSSWPMYGNDRLGDCTCAAAGHMIQAWSQAAGSPFTPADADVEAMYIPGTGAQDDGRSEDGVLSYWRTTGLGGRKITAYAYVDPSDLDEVRAAIYLFGGVYAGAGLPLTAQGQTVWDVVADVPGRNEPYSWGGHAFPYEAYDANGFVVVTWGGLLRDTIAFHNEYVDEVYAVISEDFLAAGKTPAGFDLEALEADLTVMTQH